MGILEHGTEDQKHWIVEAVIANTFKYATDVHATYVIESALQHCSPGDCRAIGEAFLADREGLLQLAEHPSGRHVVKALLRYSEQRSSVASLLQQETCRLQHNDYGSRAL